MDVTDPAAITLTLEDNDERGVRVSLTSLDIGEGESGTYTVVLTSEPTGDVTLTPARRRGAPDVTVSAALTFTAETWNVAQTLTVSAVQDTNALNAVAIVGHTASGGDYGSVTVDDVAVTVTDDDTVSSAVALTVAPAEVGEGTTDGALLTLTATLNGATRADPTPLTVTVGGTSDSAVEGTDYAALADFTITIPANAASASASFRLTPVDDDIDEVDETLTLGGATTAGLTVTDATLTIVDNEATPTLTLALSDSTISEAGGSTTVTARLNHASSAQTTVEVTARAVPPALARDIALSENTTLTIAAGARTSSGQVTLTAVDNAVDAADKTVTVTGVADNFVGVTAPAAVTLTLDDDDKRGVRVSLTSLTVGEGESGTYTVVLDTEPTGDVTLTPARRSGDPDVTVSAALTFTAATWNVAQTLTVSAAPDGDALADTAIVGHTASGGDYGSVTVDDVAVTVTDDDTASSVVALTVAPAEVSEGTTDGALLALTATLNGATRANPTPVMVAVGAADDGATGGTDYAAVADLTITIPANAASASASFTLLPVDDDIDEADETLTLGGTTAAGLTVTDATLTITDNDATPTLTLALSASAISENGGSTTVTARLNHASSAQTTVEVTATAVSPALARDIALSENTTLTIAPGATASTGVVTLTAVDNAVDAADKTVRVRGEANNRVGVTAPAAIILTLDDDDKRGVRVSLTSLTVDEGEDGTYTVVLDTEPTGDVTLTPARRSGDPDVTVSAALTFTAETWDVAQTLTVSAAPDGDALADTAIVGHTASGGDYGSVTVDDVAVTVTDDDTASSGVALTVAPTEVGEGATDGAGLTLTATLNGGTRADPTALTVVVGGARDSAVEGTDYTALADFTITIPPNAASASANFTLTPVDDDIDEANETLTLGGTTAVGLAVTGAEVTITDNDATPTLTLALSDSAISENGGSATVTARLNHASSAQTTVEVTARAVSPALARDIALSENTTLTIAPGARTSTGEVTLTAVDNAVDAADKTVRVTAEASNRVDVTAPAAITLTLEDNDVRGVRVSLTSLTVGEGEDGTYTVVLDTEPTGDVTLTPARRRGDPDVTVSAALTFTAATWNVAQTLTVSAAPDGDALADTTIVGHTVSGGDYGSVTVDDVAVTVTDDDTASSAVALTVAPAEVGEGTTDGALLTLTATLNGATRANPTPLTVAVGATGDTATGGTDYAALADFTITIPANAASASANFTLLPVDDDIDEVDETLTLGGTTTAGLAVTGATLTIVDNEATPTLTLALSDSAISEAGGSATVTARLNHASSAQTTVVVTATAVPPALARDIALSENTTLTIAPGATASTGEVTLTAVDNAVDAADKTVRVTGEASNRVDVTAPAAITLTLDDDDKRGVRVSLTSLTVGEGESGTYTVVLTSEPTGDVTLTPVRRSGDPDVTVSAALTFTAETWNVAQTLTVSAAPDADTLDDEATLKHTASGGDYGALTVDDVAVTVDDDTVLSGLPLTLAAVAGDDTINIAEQAAGFSISGATGSVAGASVTVTLGGTDLAAVTSAGDGAWSVAVPGAAAYVTGTEVALTVTAGKALYTAPTPLTRSLTVDLSAPTAPGYTLPPGYALTVGTASTALSPAGGTDIAAYAAPGLPAGLTINAASGVISGTPTTVAADPAGVTVTVTDAAGNPATVTLTLPAVGRGAQDLSGFGYSPDTITFDADAPALTAPSGAQGALSYASNNLSVCEADANSGALTILTAGTCEVTVTAAATANYNAATASFTLTVTKAAQTLSGFAYGPANIVFGDSIRSISLPSGARGALSYASDTLSVCEVDAEYGDPTILTAGTCKVTVTAAATANYNEGTASFTLTVAKADQTLSGFAYSPASAPFGTVPTLTAPSGAQGALSYASDTSSVCTVDAGSGALTLKAVGKCTISVTAAATANYNEGTATFTLTVNLAGALPLSVAAVTGDDTINIAEQAAGFSISGATGSVADVTVRVTLGSETLTAAPSAIAAGETDATWSVTVPPAADYISGAGVDLTVAAARPGYTAPTPLSRSLTVDLSAPTPPGYTPAPDYALMVAKPAAALSPAGGADIVAYAAAGLPAGLTINAASGVISGTPDRARDATQAATVTVSDTAGNNATVENLTFRRWLRARRSSAASATARPRSP